MVSLLKNSQHFYTHTIMSFGIPHITLSISAEKQRQAEREFSMRVAIDVARFISVDLVDCPCRHQCRFCYLFHGDMTGEELIYMSKNTIERATI